VTTSGADADAGFMRRALALARRGRGRTRPNPMVGAVVVRGGRVLAEGFHRRAGEPHAEIEALTKLGRRARGATMYVTLEPCCHTGRTGPCTDTIVAAGLARVVVAVRDPNPLVNGRGIARLRRAGVRVDVGVLAAEATDLNRAFFVWIAERRPLVTLKVAATLDGFIADGRPRGRAAPAWITGTAARRAAHELRARHDAILVGVGTIVADNPRLTLRLPRAAAGSGAATSPQRVILDGRLRTPPGAAALATSLGRGLAPTWVMSGPAGAVSRQRRLEAAGARVLRVGQVRGAAGRRGTIQPRAALAALAANGIQSVLVEGGARIHAAFIAAGLVDRVAVFLAPTLTGGGIPIAAGRGRPLAQALELGPLRVTRVGRDVLVEADVRRAARARSRRSRR